MRIAQVAPLYESVPPKAYGGTERVVSNLTEELVRQGHDVTLYASGDSVTKARLKPMRAKSMRTDRDCVDQLASHTCMLQHVAQEQSQYDIIHFHIDYLHYPVSNHFHVPYVTTLHGRLDIPDLIPIYQTFKNQPVISISNAQRAPLPMARWVGTVYHGLLENLYPFNEKSGDYFAFLGRISPEKRVDRAIEIATRLGLRLKIAAKVDRVDQDYFERIIKPLLNNPLIQFIGEIDEHEKSEFLSNARALLFPIDWPEPFGLVMIESMACGTPVIAFRHGSVPEVVVDGVTGFIVTNMEDAVSAARRVGALDRRLCRQFFEECFSAKRMAQDYTLIYKDLIEAQAKRKKSIPQADLPSEPVSVL